MTIFKYTIPSSGRHETIGDTIDLLGKKHCTVYVEQQQLDNYVNALGKSVEIKTLPKGTYGMGAIRKYMIDDNRDKDFIFNMDDDITSMEYRFSERLEQIVDSDHIKAVIFNAYQPALDLGTPLFCFSGAMGPLLYTQLDHILFSGMANTGLGIIPHLLGDVNFDPRLIVNEDHDISLQVKYYKRFIWMDNRYGIRRKKTWIGVGGCSTLRSKETMKKCADIMKQKYGSKVFSPSAKKDDSFVIKVGF